MKKKERKEYVLCNSLGKQNKIFAPDNETELVFVEVNPAQQKRKFFDSATNGVFVVMDVGQTAIGFLNFDGSFPLFFHQGDGQQAGHAALDLHPFVGVLDF